MKKQFLLKLGVPIVALSLIAACATGGDQEPDEQLPAENEQPLNHDDEGANFPLEDGGDERDEGLDDELREEVEDLDSLDRNNDSENDGRPDQDADNP